MSRLFKLFFLLSNIFFTLELPAATIFEKIYSEVVEKHHCRHCHSSEVGLKSADLDLDWNVARAQLVGMNSTQVNLKRVDPGNPDASYLLKKLRGDRDISGVQMPYGLPKLLPGELNLIRNWILEGALP